MLPALLLALSLHGVQKQAVTCGNNFDAHTEPLGSSTGFTIALQMHSEDDHHKDTHLCESNYSIVGTRPDGTPIKSEPRAFMGDDDAWGRSIEFWLDGFTADHNRLIASIHEDGDYPFFYIEVYELRTSRIKIWGLSDSFLKRLGPACVATLQVVGTTSNGSPVLATQVTTECRKAKALWKVEPGVAVKGGGERPSAPRLLADGAMIAPLESRLASKQKQILRLR